MGRVDGVDFRMVKVQDAWQYNPGASPPTGFLSVGAVARQYGANVSLSDMAVMEKSMGRTLSYEDFASRVPEAQVYGFSATTLEWPGAVAVAEALQRRFPSAKMIVGGPHPDCFETEYWEIEAQNTPFHVIARGQGGGAIVPSLEAAVSGASNVVVNGRFEIGDYPLPARDLLDRDFYFNPGETFSNKDIGGVDYHVGGSTSIMMSEGCPYKCTFCASPFLIQETTRDPVSGKRIGKTINFRPLDAIAAELDELRDVYGVQTVRWDDDVFSTNLRVMPGLVEMLEARFEEGTGVYSRASARIDHVWKDIKLAEQGKVQRGGTTLDQLWRAGVREIGYGFESGEDDVLALVDKDINSEMSLAVAKATKERGMRLRAFMMTGQPGETRDSGKRTIEFLEKLDPDVITLCQFTPLPGTGTFREPEKHGIKILHHDWARYNIAIDSDLAKGGEFPFVHELIPIPGDSSGRVPATRDEMVENLIEVKEWIFSRGKSNVAVYNAGDIGDAARQSDEAAVFESKKSP